MGGDWCGMEGLCAGLLFGWWLVWHGMRVCGVVCSASPHAAVVEQLPYRDELVVIAA